MAVPVPVRPTTPPGADLARTLYRLNVGQFARMIGDGTIGEEERVELIEGLLVARPRRTRAEIIAGNKGLRILWRVVPSGWHVAKGVPVLASEWSRPEPDLAVIRGIVDDDERREATAGETALVVEIAGVNRPADRIDRPRMYAEAGVPVYWIVDLIDGRVEIFAEPRRDGYQSHQVLARGQDVPVVIDGAEAAWIAVTDLLP